MSCFWTDCTEACWLLRSLYCKKYCGKYTPSYTSCHDEGRLNVDKQHSHAYITRLLIKHVHNLGTTDYSTARIIHLWLQQTPIRFEICVSWKQNSYGSKRNLTCYTLQTSNVQNELQWIMWIRHICIVFSYWTSLMLMVIVIRFTGLYTSQRNDFFTYPYNCVADALDLNSEQKKFPFVFPCRCMTYKFILWHCFLIT